MNEIYKKFHSRYEKAREELESARVTIEAKFIDTMQRGLKPMDDRISSYELSNQTLKLAKLHIVKSPIFQNESQN